MGGGGISRRDIFLLGEYWAKARGSANLPPPTNKIKLLLGCSSIAERSPYTRKVGGASPSIPTNRVLI